MIGIYQDDFKEYLEETLGYVKITNKNIITKCPWCEYQKEKDHYHLHIAKDAPIFHCFHASCDKGGLLKKLLEKIEGRDLSDEFIDKDKLKELQKNKIIFDNKDEKLQNVILPDLKTYKYPYKELYIKKRLKFFNIPLESINGLIFDVLEFIKINNIPVGESLFRIQDYLESNFIGFLTNNKTTAIFRNIDNSQSMKFYKLKIQQSNFLDYYKLPGNSKYSKKVVLAEGIFDIFSAQIFDRLNIKNDVSLYASVLSSKYLSLIHSIIFYEQIFKPDVIILSDRGIPLDYYKKLKKYNNHLFNSLTIYYNKVGKDFNDTPLIPIREVI